MKYVSIEHLKEGDIIAKGIEPYIKVNTPLTESKIEWLKSQGKRGIYIKSDFENIGAPMEETIPEQLQQDTIQSLASKNIDNAILSAAKIVEYICYDKHPKFDIWSMIDSKSNTHALNVCEFAVAVAKKAGFSNDRLIDVAVASLLHDIGKDLTIDEKKKIIFENKTLINSMNPKYTKSEENLHTVFSYGYLKDTPHISAMAKNAILYHHEYDNGTGFFGKKGDEIKDIAALIRICDEYEHKLRIFANPMVAKDQIRAGFTNKIYNSELTTVFLNTIPTYPIGTLVKLSNGLIGAIKEQNDNMDRPVVQLETGQLIDLQNVLDITINSLYNFDDKSYERKL